MNQAISISNLVKTYANGTQALKGINLQVEAGDFFALLGANGAGKTTIIGILTGLVNKTGGQASVFGHDIDREHNAAKRMIGVVPQEMNFNQFEKVEDIVLTEAGYFGIPRAEAAPECEQLLKRLELWEKRSQPSRNLSGGMKRRLMIARALITRPRLLILDEPTAGVDVELRYSMWDYLRDLNRNGLTVLLTTHYLEEVEQMCRNAAMIKDGKIITNDSVRNLVGILEKETYVVHVDRVTDIGPLADINAQRVDDNTFTMELSKGTDIAALLSKVSQSTGMSIRDFRPQGNRMEKLFLELLK
ncbi:MAG: ABC transporter ATP-binding protein [Candidatus Omnitrophica bacterium]|nr:ABC transporter ATP-binding protein [Candidatus Omnitrophota bacterium]MCB9721071.1 ABC transporter ATP-binding protein [Candidatus Omnitrophota bacterium]